ncbi:MAG TPA: class I SAM-dependent methyltransferase [Stenomitos sp.]
MDKQNEGTTLTEQAFWDDYWRNCQVPAGIDRTFSFDRCLATQLAKSLANTRGTVLEIGCAPGKWLAFFAKELGLTPSGIEYSSVGIEVTKQNLRLQGIAFESFWQGDFFDLPPQPFDVVSSFGFIEHFSDPLAVVERHVAWVKPGGLLVLGVPNFRGIYYPLQKALDVSVLEKHNLAVMEPTFFQDCAQRFGLKVDFLGYLGSFEPSLPIAKARVENTPQFLAKSFIWAARRLRRFSFWDQVNHPLISSYLLAVLRKE